MDSHWFRERKEILPGLHLRRMTSTKFQKQPQINFLAIKSNQDKFEK
jgi:hypothetical protein